VVLLVTGARWVVGSPLRYLPDARLRVDRGPSCQSYCALAGSGDWRDNFALTAGEERNRNAPAVTVVHAGARQGGRRSVGQQRRVAAHANLFSRHVGHRHVGGFTPVSQPRGPTLQRRTRGDPRGSGTDGPDAGRTRLGGCRLQRPPQ
jgi:hypothetical protein